jgi:hypothetical protein
MLSLILLLHTFGPTLNNGLMHIIHINQFRVILWKLFQLRWWIQRCLFSIILWYKSRYHTCKNLITNLQNQNSGLMELVVSHLIFMKWHFSNINILLQHQALKLLKRQRTSYLLWITSEYCTLHVQNNLIYIHYWSKAISVWLTTKQISLLYNFDVRSKFYTVKTIFCCIPPEYIYFAIITSQH